ncbi:MAG: GNAT family N-acetyltransferase [Candidatus Woesearchaeota archaeon]
MDVRKAKTADIDSINALDRESVKYHAKFDKDYYTISEEWWNIKKDSQLKAMRSPKNSMLVALIDDTIVGYVWGSIDILADHKIGRIQELIVTSRYRRRGIGKTLINEMLEYFKGKNCVVCEIGVEAGNTPTIKAYENAGFSIREHKMRLKLDKKKRFRPFY